MPPFTSPPVNLQEAGPVLDVIIATTFEDILRKKGPPLQLEIFSIPVAAMIDTGATGTVINEDIIQKLNLKPVGVVLTNTPSSENFACYEYAVRIIFPANNISIDTVAIAAPLLGQHVQCLIGRDILSKSVFIYNGLSSTFTLSF